jgi:hypothetical protein
MTDSRWLQELTNSYINNSAGVPSNINEELINEQAQYISELEAIVISIAEALEVSVEDLMEYQVSDKNRNTPKGEALAKRYAGRVKGLVSRRNDKLNSDGKAIGNGPGMAQGEQDARLGDRLNKATTAAGAETRFNSDPSSHGYIHSGKEVRTPHEHYPIGKDTPLNISKVPEADREMAHKELTAMGNADRVNRRAEAAKLAAAIEKKRAERAHADKWTV